MRCHSERNERARPVQVWPEEGQYYREEQSGHHDIHGFEQCCHNMLLFSVQGNVVRRTYVPMRLAMNHNIDGQACVRDGNG